MSGRDTVEEVFAAWDSGDFEVIRRLYSADYLDHDPMPGTAGGVEGVIQQIQMLTGAFSGGRTEVKDVIADGDKVCIRWCFTGTHTGSFMGAPASGNNVSMQGIEIHRIEDGKIAEGWTTVDLVALMMQIGAIPPPD